MNINFFISIVNNLKSKHKFNIISHNFYLLNSYKQSEASFCTSECWHISQSLSHPLELFLCHSRQRREHSYVISLPLIHLHHLLCHAIHVKRVSHSRHFSPQCRQHASAAATRGAKCAHILYAAIDTTYQRRDQLRRLALIRECFLMCEFKAEVMRKFQGLPNSSSACASKEFLPFVVGPENVHFGTSLFALLKSVQHYPLTISTLVTDCIIDSKPKQIDFEYVRINSTVTSTLVITNHSDS